jgi:hypothetical protein
MSGLTGFKRRGPQNRTRSAAAVVTAGRHTLLVSPSSQPESFRRLSHPWWSTPLADNAVVHPSSDRYVTALIAQLRGTPTTTPFAGGYPKPYNTITQSGDYSAPTYTVPTGTALQKVYVSDNKTVYVNGANTDLKTLMDKGVPVPDPTLMSSGTIAADGTDGHVMIFQTFTAADGIATARLWEFWQFRPGTSTDVANGYPWRCAQGGYIEDVRYHSGWWQGSDQGTSGGNWGVSASGASYANATLTGRDWARFQSGLPLDHPLILQVVFSGGQPEDLASGALAGGNFFPPATRYDRMNSTGKANSDVYRIPEGTRYRLDPAVWTDAAIASYAAANGTTSRGDGATTAQLAWFLKGFRSHGFIAAESAGVVAIVAEHPKTFGTIYNPYTAVPQWGNVLQQYPSTGVVAVKNIPFRIDYPTGGPTASAQPEKFDYSLAPIPDSVKTNLLPSSAANPQSTSVVALNGTGATFAVNTTYQPDGKNAITVTYGTASTDAGVAWPTVSGIAPGDRIGFRVITRRHKGSKRLVIALKWRAADGSLVQEQAGTYITRVLETDQVEEFTATAPTIGPVTGVAVVVRAQIDTPSSTDSFSVGGVQVWKISSPA